MPEKLVNQKEEIIRLPLHIEGLDENIESGIPQGHIVLVCGSAGTMKSSICFNSIYNNAVEGKHGLYLSLEQSAESLLNHVINMGYDLTKINLQIIKDFGDFKNQAAKIKSSKKGTVMIADLGAIRKEVKDVKVGAGGSWVNVIKNMVKKIKETAELDLFTLDSLSALYVLSHFENPRAELFLIFEFLRDLNVTSFLISEMPLDGSRYSEYEVEDYLSDGIIYIKLTKMERKVIREISVVKMRTTDCNHDIFSLEVKHAKFKAVYGGKTPLL